MARPLRIEFAGAVYHVTSRGNGRENIFYDDIDRKVWLRVFADVCERYRWICHAWCLMGNHYHVVIETVDANLAAGMRHLNGVYTQKINYRHQRVGHVFQGRYKAILVEKESHLLELARYVVLNPLRAELVDDIALWPWSSYRAMISSSASPAWLHTDWLLSQFGMQRSEAVRRYIDFVRAGMKMPPIWRHLRGQIYLGSESFAQTMQSAGIVAAAESETFKEIPRPQRLAPALPLSHYRSQYADRNVAIVAAYASGAFTMQQIARGFGLHYSTVSRTVNMGSGLAITHSEKQNA